MDKLSTLHLCGWLRFKHLILLTYLAESRNMHVAARAMHLSQPAASKMLKDLEDYFGFALFERLPRAMHPTELGEQVIRHARILLNDAERLVDDINDLREGGYGHLLIGAIAAAAPEILPAAIACLKRRRPRLSVSLQEQTSDRLLLDLEHKRLDLVIGRLTHVSQHNLFDFEPLLDEPLRVVVRRDHPLAVQNKVPGLAELSRWPWVLHPLSSPMRGVFEAALAEEGVPTPTNIVETTSIQATLQLLQTSDSLAVLPRSVLRRPLEGGQYVTLNRVIGKPLDYYGIVSRRGEMLPPAAQELIGYLREEARKDSHPRRDDEVVASVL
ncbi:LysR substrate-binding domain-containing protein [Halomonas sp. McH1-25]|uniref:LysR substrate-binding domain-containing protein n=1 Tax=unclassified Halomonas TaxID=2609666 RepID=UPI001EF4D179|nr:MULTISPECIES: LysR substrate-binding domain-containing protein [unclassified Halomonas]MCG7599919.1 LysR substrate-binding domain-containing protein [Halomonas sp. McH1-25]MCP1342610.1 LysR substrate-binding domain-containing protein [Halomonas sp. FL8]MCP1361325.1 LysR substrate-binding domain-containing protein [Halomonas sp. BBD45]